MVDKNTKKRLEKLEKIRVRIKTIQNKAPLRLARVVKRILKAEDNFCHSEKNHPLKQVIK